MTTKTPVRPIYDPYDRLEHLDAMGAIKAWLLGDYRRGEERVLILAIRRETGLELTDGEIRDVLVEAVNDEIPAMLAFERLLLREAVAGADDDHVIVRPR